MKQTKKYRAGLKAYKAFKGSRLTRTFENDELYQMLADKGFWWDAANGEWTNRKQPSNSIFKTDDDVASGVIRLRVMAHPDDVDHTVALVKKTIGMRVIEVSDPYENRKGAGVRVYLTCVLDKVHE
jgi:hypothetical protein